ncbi:potassium channel family protein [Peptostreptococcus russellii]|uniref:potassium channel family protein n=1 Tax=Peptostreptococcus russellii TaxID=215200 RepID=UPI0026EFE915|nr:NAD-binding protein [Peptostreptococcus russellii]
MKKNIILIGGKNKAKSLSISLMEQGYRVTVVNKDYNDCLELAEVNKLNVIHGDGTKPYILDEADADEADMVIALTPKDEDNLVACQLCKKKFGVKKAVSLVSDPRKTDFFYKMFIDNTICAISEVTRVIEQNAFIEEMTSVVSIADGRIKIIQIKIDNGDCSVNKKLWELEFPRDTIVACIMRGQDTIIPRGDTRIISGDIAVAISSHHDESEIIKELKGSQKNA